MKKLDVEDLLEKDLETKARGWGNTEKKGAYPNI